MSIRCSRCNLLIKKRSPLGFQSLSDEIMTLKIGSFAIVFSRRYFVIGLLIVICLCWLFFTIPIRILVISDISWTDYINDCSAENIIKNQRNVNNVFLTKYAGQTIS